MNQWRRFLAGILLGTLCACAAQKTGTSPTTKSSTGSIASSITATDLPCAEVSGTEAITVRYPVGSLYRGGAVLPKEEGLACLEVLSDWLKNTPQNKWQVTVSGEDGHGFDPKELAKKRQELLQRFFTRKGIEMKNWEWQAESGQVGQLQLVEVKGLP